MQASSSSSNGGSHASRRATASSSPPPPSLAHLYSSASATPALSAPVSSALSPESRARRVISAALRDARSGSRPLLHVAVVGYRVVAGSDLVLYDVVVQGVNNLRWQLTRRFAEFASLNAALEKREPDPSALPPFPRKEWRWLVNHIRAEFLDARLALLDNFLRRLLAHAHLRSSDELLDFLRPNSDELMDHQASSPTGAVGAGGGNQRASFAALASGSSSAGSVDSAGRGSSLASSSLHDELFEPRSFEDELRNERREQLHSLSRSHGESAPASGSATMPGPLYSESFAVSRRTSHSQVYDPLPPPPSSAAFASSAASTAAASSSLAAPAPASSSSLGLSVASSSPLSAPAWISPEVSDVSIPVAQVLKNHVVFRVDVENIAKLAAFARWTMLKRFNDFCTLDAKIREEVTRREKEEAEQRGAKPVSPSPILAHLPLLPRRELKLLTDHFSPRFIEARRILLEVYLRKLISVPALVSLDCVLEFLGCT